MAIQFYDLTVSRVNRETDKAVSVFFDIPENLKDTFNYKSGQYITLKFNIGEDSPRRAYSLSTSPFTDSEFGVTVKEVDGGVVSTYINKDLKAGDKVAVMPPLGHFTTIIDEHNIRRFVMFAGGSGITPIISLIKSILEVEVNSRVTLVYANKNQESIIFKDQLKDLFHKYSDKFNLIHILDDGDDEFECEEGLLSSTRIEEILNKYNVNIHDSEYFICGPSAMMGVVEQGLNDLKVRPSLINKESFTASENQNERTNSDESELIAGDEAQIKVTIYGEDFEFSASKNDTILGASIKNQLDPPFSCQIGACSTCMAIVEKGEVRMEDDSALTPDEIEDGYVLTCTAHAVSDKVEINYDY